MTMRGSLSYDEIYRELVNENEVKRFDGETIYAKTKYLDEPAIVRFGGYSADDSLAIQLFARNGEPLAMATVCTVDYGVTPPFGDVVVKDYSENEGMLHCLVKEGVVHLPNHFFGGPNGVVFYVCKLTPAALQAAIKAGYGERRQKETENE